MDKNSIKIVGLGPGSVGHLSSETLEQLSNAKKVILRTKVHPTVLELEKKGIVYESCDRFYESAENFEQVYQNIANYVLKQAQEQSVVYAVPGSPLVAEQTVVLLREMTKDKEIEFEILPAISFLDIAYVKAGLDPIEGLRIVDASDEKALLDAGKYPLILTQVYSRLVAADTKIKLMEVLKDNATIYFMRNLGLPDEEFLPIKLYELDRQKNIDHLTTILVPCCEESILDEYFEIDMEDEPFEDEDETYDVSPLTEVMTILREPDGCVWDREQTHESIRNSLIEEAYEVIDAIDNKDTENLKEELGDLLLQIVFHSQIACEKGVFDLQDVIDDITEKLIRRHPHVFGNVEVSDSSEVVDNWENIKSKEKTERTRVLDGVPKGFPALLRAYKLQKKAKKVGFDWENIKDVRKKIEEEIKELDKAVDESSKSAVECEIGDVLFTIVNYARHLGVEPETALNKSNNKFIKRFEFVENKVKETGRKWEDFSLEELDVFWNEAKKLESKDS